MNHEPQEKTTPPVNVCLYIGVKPSDLVEKCTTFLQHFRIRIQNTYSPNQTATNPTSLHLAYRPLCIFSPDVGPWKACSTVKLKHATHFSKQAPRRVLTVDMSSRTNIASKHNETATQSYHAHATTKGRSNSFPCRMSKSYPDKFTAQSRPTGDGPALLGPLLVLCWASFCTNPLTPRPPCSENCA